MSVTMLRKLFEHQALNGLRRKPLPLRSLSSDPKVVGQPICRLAECSYEVASTTMERAQCQTENRRQYGLASLEVRLERLGQSAYIRPRHHVCSHSQACRRLVCNRNQLLLGRRKLEPGRLRTMCLVQRQVRQLDCKTHIELELGYLKQTSSQRLRVSRLVI